MSEIINQIENHLMQAAGIMRNGMNKAAGIEQSKRAIIYFKQVLEELERPEVSTEIDPDETEEEDKEEWGEYFIIH